MSHFFDYFQVMPKKLHLGLIMRWVHFSDNSLGNFMNYKLREVLFIFIGTFWGIVFLSSVSFAQGERFPNTRISIYQTLYSGLNAKSFSKIGKGFGAEISSMRDAESMPFYVKGRASYIGGEQIFLDNTTEVTSSFTYYQGVFEMGFVFFPITRKKSGFNVFFSGGGTFGYNYITLDKSLTLTNLQYSDQAVSTGYAGGLGCEIVINRQGGDNWSLSAELSYRSETAKFLKQDPFDLSGVSMIFGIGW